MGLPFSYFLPGKPLRNIRGPGASFLILNNNV